MTGLTPDQIVFGAKGRMTSLGPILHTAQTIDAGDDGPCATCHQPTVRYGPDGQPLCTTCRKDTPA